MKLAPIWDPSVRKPDPKPVRVDLFPLFLGGTLVWAVAGIVCLVCYLCGAMSPRAAITCAAGVIIGAMLLVWERRERSTYRLLGKDDNAAASAATPDTATADSATPSAE